MKWINSLWLLATLATIISGAVVNIADNTNTEPNVETKLEGASIINSNEKSNVPATETNADTGNSVPNPEGGTGDPVPSPEEEPSAEVQEAGPVVETLKGSVRGIPWPGSKQIFAYFDIPYGQYKSNFAAPNESESWEGIMKNSQHTSRCPQLDGDALIGETDCLTLTIFTPADLTNAPYSVLFYIHESDFTTGSGDPAIYGPDYLVSKNVVLVLPNYRLGPLGFLCYANETIPGNAGLKDLALALEWTVNNIEAFGGDPTNIAVSGDGASAALAGYLALSPKSRSYIRKVITDSGTVLSHWAIDRDPVLTANEVANEINNNSGTDITNASLENLFKSAKGIMIRPCIEYEGFMTDTPWSILEKEKTNITFIIGSANHAGLAEALQHDEASITSMRENFGTMIPNDLVFANDADRTYVGNRLRLRYFPDGNITLLHSEGLSLFHTDASYLGPSVRLARALVGAGATVFLHEFSFVGELNKGLVSLGDAPQYGAVRGDVAGYLFSRDGRVPLEGSKEKKMVELMTELWVSFLQTGIPASGEHSWSPVNHSDVLESWLTIGEETSAQTGLHTDRLSLWAELYRDHFIERNSAPWPRANAVGLAVFYFIVFFRI